MITEKEYKVDGKSTLTPLKILSLLTASGLTSHLAAVKYRCTPGRRDITVGCGYRCTEM